MVCKVDVQGCSDVSEGERVVIVQYSDRNAAADGVNKLVVLDDNLLGPLQVAPASSAGVHQVVALPARLH